MCQLLEVPRSLVYRKPCDRPERARFYRELTFEIADVLDVHPGYGYRRVRKELAKRSVDCGYKSVSRAMKEADFQRHRKRPHPKTSDGKGRGKYPNLLDGSIIDAPGKVWVADITYIGLPGGYAYLACILDVFLRKIVGRAMSLKIDAKLTLEALSDALSKRKPEPGWIHHSDRGSQYLSDEYKKRVLEAGGQISCSDKGSPQDNAFMESFFKTLKVEEVWLEEYESFRHADQSIAKFINSYNADRMHSSLNYLSPEEFERQIKDNDQS